jgi:hypothetical protein
MSSSEAKLLDAVRKLPEAAVWQVIDYAEYLSAKYSSSNLTYSKYISRQEMAHLEEEFADYRKRYPRE